MNLENFLIGIDVNGDKVIGCRYSIEDNRYILRIRCGKCGEAVEKKFNSNNVLAFRCLNCNRRWYILGKLANNSKDIIGYKILTNHQYRNLRADYKNEALKLDFCDYIQRIFNSL